MNEFALSSCSYTERTVTTKQQISEALRALDAGAIEFLILARESEKYVQAVGDEKGYIVERRDGNANSHCSAILLPSGGALTLNDAEAIFFSFFSKAPFPRNIEWQKTELSGAAPVYGLAAIGLLAVFIIGCAWWWFA